MVLPAAGPERKTVPPEGEPPITLVGFTLTLSSKTGLTVKAAVTLTSVFLAPVLAVSVTAVAAVTAEVAILKFALLCPPATTTLGATAAAVLLDDKLTVRLLPAASGPVRLTVPSAGFPPVTVEGETVSEDNWGARIFNVADLLVPFAVAVITADVLAATGKVFTAKVCDLEPSGTIMLAAGRLAAGFPLDKFTIMPPAGAALLSVTVPVVDWLPVTEELLKLTDCGTGGLGAIAARKNSFSSSRKNAFCPTNNENLDCDAELPKGCVTFLPEPRISAKQSIMEE